MFPVDRERDIYIMLYVKDFLAYLTIAYFFEIMAVGLMEFAPFEYFDHRQVLFFMALFPLAVASLIMPLEILRFEKVGERFKEMNISGVERR